MSVFDTPGVIRYVMANDPDAKPRPTTARHGCPRCRTLWEVSGFAWQFECKCRRWSIDATGAESWKAIPGARPYCCGREMERAITARQYECACGRVVPERSHEASAEIDIVIDSVGDDTARSEWREPWPSAAGGPMHVLSAPIVAPPPPPTDARIVEAWQAARVRDRVYGYAHDDAAGHALAAVMVDGHPVTRAEFQAAWSRVLAAKVAASDAARTEAARRVVLGPIDDESEA